MSDAPGREANTAVDATTDDEPARGAPATDDGASALPERDRRFYLWLGGITLAGLAWRVIYILVWRRHALDVSMATSSYPVWGDAYFYHESAKLIAEGKGWINPLVYRTTGVANQAADHPPIYLLYLALWSWLGFTSPLSHMLVSALVGSVTIFVAGLAGRQILSRRVGVIAALIAAFYPNIWGWDGMILSETFAILFVVVTLWLAYRFWRRPTLLGAIALGVSVAAATLSRAELLLLSVLIITPLVLTVRGRPWRLRIGWLAAAAAACVAVLAPWVSFNLSRFDKPVYLSAGFEITLATATCDHTFYGPMTGYWSMACPLEFLEKNNITGAAGDEADQSVRSDVFQRESLDYLTSHKSRLPVVVLARWGRITGLWKPVQQAQLDHFPEGREIWVANSALVWWYGLAAFAIVGGITLRRRKVPVYPLLGPLITVFLMVTILFAQNRYRASAEGAIALLAAVGIDALLRWWRDRRRAGNLPAAPPA